jgi:hypothetical protein
MIQASAFSHVNHANEYTPSVFLSNLILNKISVLGILAYCFLIRSYFAFVLGFIGLILVNFEFERYYRVDQLPTKDQAIREPEHVLNVLQEKLNLHTYKRDAYKALLVYGCMTSFIKILLIGFTYFDKSIILAISSFVPLRDFELFFDDSMQIQQVLLSITPNVVVMAIAVIILYFGKYERTIRIDYFLMKRTRVWNGILKYFILLAIAWTPILRICVMNYAFILMILALMINWAMTDQPNTYFHYFAQRLKHFLIFIVMVQYLFSLSSFTARIIPFPPHVISLLGLDTFIIAQKSFYVHLLPIST